MKRIFIAVVILSTISLSAQEKPDSTMFKFWVNEFEKVSKQAASVDTLRIKLQGIKENAYLRAVEEQKKLQPKKEEAKK